MPDHPTFRVRTEHTRAAVVRPVFELRPDTWDDFSLKTTFDLVYLRPNVEPLEFGRLKIMQRAMESGRVIVPTTFNELPDDYCSLGQSFSYYEAFASLPTETGRRALLGLRDVVVDTRRRTRFEDLPEFEMSLAREPRAIRALEDAPRLFERPKRKQAGGLAIPWIARVNVAPDSVVTLGLDFTPVAEGVPSSIVALVGDNGTGKSSVLDGLASAAAEPPPSFLGVEALSTVQGGRVNVARVITIAYSAFDKSRLYGLDRHEVDDSRSLVKTTHFYRGLRRTDPDGRLTNALKSPEDLENEVWDAARSFSLGDRELLRSALAILREVSPLPEHLVDALLSGRPGQGLAAELSSGQIMVLNIVVSLVAYLEPGSLVLIDEPETHLHPPMIAALVRAVAMCSTERESVVVLATHSSVVVQQLQSRNVLVLRRAGDRTWVETPEIETYGESLGKIDRAVFDLQGVDTDFTSVLRRLALKGSLRSAERRLGAPLSGQARALFLSVRKSER